MDLVCNCIWFFKFVRVIMFGFRWFIVCDVVWRLGEYFYFFFNLDIDLLILYMLIFFYKIMINLGGVLVVVWGKIWKLCEENFI